MSKRGDNIHKRIDGRWEGRYQKGRKEDGTIIYGSVYGRSYHEAKEKLLGVIQEKCKYKIPKQKEMTFGQVLELWMQKNRIRLKGGSISKYQRLIDTHIMNDLGGIKMSKMSSKKINAFLEQKLRNGRIDGKGGLSTSYVNSIAIIIQSTLDYAVEERLCLPIKVQVSKPLLEKNKLCILSLTDQKKLELFAIQDLSVTTLGILVSLYTGLRIGEVCALRWEDIDFTQKILMVRHTIARVNCTHTDTQPQSKLILDSPKTKSSMREIPIPSALLPLLERLHESSTSKYVTSETATFVSPRTYEYRYHKVLEECGIKSINYHALRHTFATRCIEAGVDVKSLSEILGHANVSITLNTYVHSSIELKRKQLEKMSALSA